MPDTLNPESLRPDEHSRLKAKVTFSVKSEAGATPWEAFDAALDTYLAAEAERVQSIGLVRTSLAEMQHHHAARRALSDAIGDLLHMHRQGVVSAEMWERVAAAFDGAKP